LKGSSCVLADLPWMVELHAVCPSLDYSIHKTFHPGSNYLRTFSFLIMQQKIGQWTCIGDMFLVPVKITAYKSHIGDVFFCFVF